MMRLKNQNGSVLVIVLGFILVFTLLGIGSLHHSFVQNEIAEKEKASAEAFWIADGAAEKGLSKLNEGLDPSENNVPLGRGTYNVYINSACGPNCIETQGLVNGQYRSIRANAVGLAGNMVFNSWVEI